MAATYYIDNEKKIIICKITDCTFDAINLIEKFENCSYKFLNRDEADKYYINDSYVGKATCQDGDIYDEEFGKKLAKKKMLKKYHVARDRAILRYINNNLKKTEKAIDYMSKFNKIEE